MPPRKKTSDVAPATRDADDGSEESEEMSDPEDDIADVEFDTVRDAARDRLALTMWNRSGGSSCPESLNRFPLVITAQFVGASMTCTFASKQ